MALSTIAIAGSGAAAAQEGVLWQPQVQTIIGATSRAATPRSKGPYPIGFVGPQKAPVVITGLRQNENLFVEPDGSWTAPNYVPAYVRRYPFVLAEDKQPAERLTLCIDRDSDRIVEAVAAPLASDGAVATPLFDGAEPSQATRGALEL